MNGSLFQCKVGACINGCRGSLVLMVCSVLWLVTAARALGQVNDTCQGAVELLSGVTNSVDTFGATSSGEPEILCGKPFGAGVWYTIKPSIEYRVGINTSGSDFPTMMAVYTGECGSLTEVQCSGGTNPLGAEANRAGVEFIGAGGATYHILIGGSGEQTGHLQTVATLSSVFPANGNCAQAIPVLAGVDYNLDAGRFPGRGVWYTYSMAGNGRLNVSTCGSDFPTLVTVYSGRCGALEMLADSLGANPFCGGGTNAGVSVSGADGVTYYIWIRGRDGGNGNLRFSVDHLPAPPNDTLSGALTLAPGVTQSINTLGATEFYEPYSLCGGTTIGRGVWYAYTATRNGQVAFSTCGSDFPTAMSVYARIQGALVPTSCNEYKGPSCNENRASVVVDTRAGETYYLLVGGLNGAGGNLKLFVASVDLTAERLEVAETLMAGQYFSVEWSIRNRSTNSITGIWNDRILVRNPTTNVSLVVTFASPGNIPSAPAQGSYTNSVVSWFPTLPEGQYSLVLEADFLDSLVETDEGNNAIQRQITVISRPASVHLLKPVAEGLISACRPVEIELSASFSAGTYPFHHLEYFDGATLIGQSPGKFINSTYTPPVLSIPLAHGSHLISAQAVDIYGGRGTSAAVNLHIKWPDLNMMTANFSSNGEMVCCMGALDGRDYMIEAASAIQRQPLWQSLYSVRASNSVILFTNQTSATQDYYRVRLPF